MNPKKQVVKFRRKLQGKTHYRKRLKLLKSGEYRAVIRVTSRDTTIQFIKFQEKGDEVAITSNNTALKKLGWKYPCGNIVTSYLTGIIAGSKAKKMGIKSAVLDIGLQPNVQYSKVYAALKGIISAGINIPHNKDVLPSDDRVNGEHIVKFFELVNKDNDKYQNQFSKISKEGFEPEKFKNDIQSIVKKATGAQNPQTKSKAES